MHQPFSSYHYQAQEYTPAGYDQNYYQYGDGTGYAAGYDGTGYDPQNYNYYTSGWFNFSDPCYLKGLVIGAGLTFLLTNSTVQRAIVRGAVNLTSVVQGGVEEVKEQIKDIKAEMSQKEE